MGRGFVLTGEWLLSWDERLSHEDIAHYQKMIVALAETARLMNEVDAVLKI